MSLTQSWSASELLFSDSEEATIRKRATTLSAEHRLSDDWTLTLGGGATVGGDVEVAGERYELDPGFVVVGGGSYRILDGSGDMPFLLFGVMLGVGYNGTERVAAPESATLLATDARFSLAIGKLFWDGIAPYAAVRGFGGPVFWERNDATLVGSDRYHFQLGGGVLATAGVVDAYFEVVPLGERALSLGAAVAF